MNIIDKYILQKKFFEALNLSVEKTCDYFKYYDDIFYNNLIIYPNLIETLEFFKSKGVKMYILTNNGAAKQVRKLKKLGILNYFEKVYTSEEFGVEKPDLKLFSSIVAEIGVKFSEVAMMGDSFEHDVRPAVQLGMYGIWLKYNKVETFRKRTSENGKLFILKDSVEKLGMTQEDILEKTAQSIESILDVYTEYMEVYSYSALLSFFRTYYSELDKFIDFSHRAGERVDLTQAGGGNSSFKLKYDQSSERFYENQKTYGSTNLKSIIIDLIQYEFSTSFYYRFSDTTNNRPITNFLFVKSSGSKLTDIRYNENYTCLDLDKINKMINGLSDDFAFTNQNKKALDKEVSNDLVKLQIFMKQYKPSIETTLHAISPYKYTLHLHPIEFNRLSSKSDYEELMNIYINDGERNSEDYLNLSYFTPGIETTLNIKKKLTIERKDSSNELFKICFLKSHGAVVTLDNDKELLKLIDTELDFMKGPTDSEINEHKNSNLISKSMNRLFFHKKVNFITYLSQDRVIKSKLEELKINENVFKPSVPDTLIYCGRSALILNPNELYTNSLEDKQIEFMEKELTNYFVKYKEIPKIVVVNHSVYIVSDSLDRCRDIEQVLKAHLLCYGQKNQILSEDEIRYLINWDAEKFRQNIK